MKIKQSVTAANLLNDSDPEQLSRDMEKIAESRRARARAADFESYLDFLEESAALLGFKKRKREKFFIEPGKQSLLL